jgi:phosphate uptake regulator
LPAKGNPRIVVRLDPLLKSGLEALALARGVDLARLVRGILLDYAHEVAATRRGVAATLDRITVLIGTLEVQAYSVGIAGVQTQAEREELYATALALLKEAVKLAQSEEAASNALARMEAMRLVSNMSRTALAVLAGYDRSNVEALLDEVRRTNESLQRQLRAGAEGAASDTSAAGEKKA